MVQDGAHQQTESLATWVADLAVVKAHKSFNNRRFTAAGDSVVSVAFPEHLDADLMVTLTCRADTIAGVSQEFSVADIADVISGWSSLAASKAHAYGTRLHSAFWTTFIGDSLPWEGDTELVNAFRSLRSFVLLNFIANNKAISENEIIAETARELLSSGAFEGSSVADILKESERHIYSEWFKCVEDRRFYVTENGFMGLCQPSVTAGDQVHIFSGAPTPFILEPNDEVIVGGESRGYYFKGDTYIHGLMHGEALGREGFAWSKAYIL